MDANGNNLIVVTYLLYLLISVAITIWVARTLYKSGGVFLVDAFHGNAELAGSVNHLLVVGFYLINIGYVSLALKTGSIILSSRAANGPARSWGNALLQLVRFLPHSPKLPTASPARASASSRARCAAQCRYPAIISRSTFARLGCTSKKR